jgi:hypothetical protein
LSKIKASRGLTRFGLRLFQKSQKSLTGAIGKHDVRCRDLAQTRNIKMRLINFTGRVDIDEIVP